MLTTVERAVCSLIVLSYIMASYIAATYGTSFDSVGHMLVSEHLRGVAAWAQRNRLTECSELH